MAGTPSIPPASGSQASPLRRRARLLLVRFHVPADALPGSLALSHRRCGKPSCHCADGDLHPLWTLTFMAAARSVSRPFPPTGSTPFVHGFKRADASKKPPPNCWSSTPSCWCWPETSVPAQPAVPLHPPRRGTSHAPTAPASSGAQPAVPLHPVLADDPPRFVLLEREVELEYRPRMLAALQSKVDAVADAARDTMPMCPHCGRPMRCQDTRLVSWLARCGRLHAPVSRYRCPPCRHESRPLLDLLICWRLNRVASAARWPGCWLCWQR